MLKSFPSAARLSSQTPWPQYWKHASEVWDLTGLTGHDIWLVFFTGKDNDLDISTATVEGRDYLRTRGYSGPGVAASLLLLQVIPLRPYPPPNSQIFHHSVPNPSRCNPPWTDFVLVPPPLMCPPSFPSTWVKSCFQSAASLVSSTLEFGTKERARYSAEDLGEYSFTWSLRLIRGTCCQVDPVWDTWGSLGEPFSIQPTVPALQWSPYLSRFASQGHHELFC